MNMAGHNEKGAEEGAEEGPSGSRRVTRRSCSLPNNRNDSMSRKGPTKIASKSHDNSDGVNAQQGYLEITSNEDFMPNQLAESDESNENQIAEVSENETDINSLRRLTKEIQYQVSKKVHLNQKAYDYLMPRTQEINRLLNTVLKRTEALEVQNAQLLAAFSRMDAFESAIKDLQATIKTVTPTTTTQKTQHQGPTYAQTAKKIMEQIVTESNSSSGSNTVLISAPSVTGATPKEIKESIQKAVNLQEEGWQIVSHKGTKNGKLALRTATQRQAQTIADSKKLKEAGLETEVLEKRRPRIVLYDIPTNMSAPEVQEAIIAQNFKDENARGIKEQLLPKFKLGRKHQERENWVCEVEPELRKRLLEKRRIYIQFNSCKVDDYIGITRCYKCQSFGHIAKYCRAESTTCGHCAQTGHRRANCTKLEAPPKCAVCNRFGKDDRHDTTDNECPALKAEILSRAARTDYG